MGIFPYAVIAAAAFIQGLSSFGFALVSVPLLLTQLSPGMVIPASIIQGILNNFMVLWPDRRQVHMSGFLPLLVSGFIGTNAGVYLLLIINPALLKSIVGIVTFAFAFSLWFDVKLPIREDRRTVIGVGLLSGVLNGCIAFSGPPVILYFAAIGAAREKFRATLSAYFLLLGLLSLPAFWLSGMLTPEVWAFAGFSLPWIFLATIGGILISRRLSQAHFRRLTIILVALLGLLSVVSAAGDLF